MKQTRFVSKGAKNTKYKCTIAPGSSTNGQVIMNCVPPTNASRHQEQLLRQGSQGYLASPTKIQARRNAAVISKANRMRTVQGKINQGDDNCYNGGCDGDSQVCCGHPSIQADYWEGLRFSKARGSCQIGIIWWNNDYDVPEQQYRPNLEPLTNNLASYFNVERVIHEEIRQSDYIDEQGDVIPEAVDATVLKMENFIKTFKRKGIYRVQLPQHSVILGPFLRGDHPQLGGVAFKDRHPDVIATTWNPGTSAVQEQDNVFRFLEVTETHDPDYSALFYDINNFREPINGKILLPYYAAPGIDEDLAFLYAYFFDLFFGAGTSILFPLTPNVGLTDYNESGALATAVANLPAGSIVSTFANASPVSVASWSASPFFNQIWTNSSLNGTVTQIPGNFGIPAGFVFTNCDIQFGTTSGLIDFPTAFSSKFGYSSDIQDALDGVGLWIFGITPIDVFAWLATAGHFQGVNGNLVFYQQSNVNREIWRTTRYQGDNVNTIELLGLSGRFFRVVNGEPIGTFDFLFTRGDAPPV